MSSTHHLRSSAVENGSREQGRGRAKGRAGDRERSLSMGTAPLATQSNSSRVLSVLANKSKSHGSVVNCFPPHSPFPYTCFEEEAVEDMSLPPPPTYPLTKPRTAPATSSSASALPDSSSDPDHHPDPGPAWFRCASRQFHRVYSVGETALEVEASQLEEALKRVVGLLAFPSHSAAVPVCYSPAHRTFRLKFLGEYFEKMFLLGYGCVWFPLCDCNNTQSVSYFLMVGGV